MTTPTEFTVKAADGTRIAGDSVGPKEGECLVLAHGVALDRQIWDDSTPYLAKRFRVVRYDARGHGRSGPSVGPATLDVLVDDAVRILDGAGVDKAHFAGHSMGGMIGLGLALRHPDRVHTVAACNARGESTPEYRKSWEDRMALVTSGGMESIADNTIARWLTPKFRARQPGTVELLRSLIVNTPVEGYCACATAIRDLDYKRHLAVVRMPVLFLTGSDDPGAPPDIAQRMHAATRNSSLAIIQDAAHISVVEQQDAFLAALGGFIGRHRRSA